MKSFNIKILGVAETHWNNSVKDTFQPNGYAIIHSARKDEIRRQGVAIVIEKELSKCMTSYALTLERIMSVTLKTNTGCKTKYSLGETNKRCLRVLPFCSLNKYVLTNTTHKHKPNKRFTWTCPDGKTKSQIDFISPAKMT